VGLACLKVTAMAYDWRPTPTRDATTDPHIVPATRRKTAQILTPKPPPPDISVDAAIDEFLEAAEGGQALNRSGRPYRPSALRDLRGILKQHVSPQIGEMQLRGVRRQNVQVLVDRLAAQRLSLSRIRSVVSAMRALYGYAIERGYVEFSPANSLQLPPEGDPAARVDSAAWNWSDEVDGAQADEPPSWARTTEPARAVEGSGDYRPLAQLPERILSLVLRIVVILFVLFALVTIAESV
jgi:hypothetical protein